MICEEIIIFSNILLVLWKIIKMRTKKLFRYILFCWFYNFIKIFVRFVINITVLTEICFLSLVWTQY